MIVSKFWEKLPKFWDIMICVKQTAEHPLVFGCTKQNLKIIANHIFSLYVPQDAWREWKRELLEL